MADAKRSAMDAWMDKWGKRAKATAASAAHEIGTIDAEHGHVLTRGVGVLQAVGGAAEGLAGLAVAGAGGAASTTAVGAVPGVPAMIGGGALAVNGADNAIAGLRTAWTGEFHHTLVSQAAGAAAHVAGASDATRERIVDGVDLAQGIAGAGGSIAAGLARKTASATAKKLAAEEAERLAAEEAQAARRLATNRAEFERYQKALREAMVKPAVKDPELSGLMDKLYRANAQVGSGSTAAAVRKELATGVKVGGKLHAQKAKDSILALQRWLKSHPEASPGDRAAAENVIKDMTDALAGR